MMIFLNPLDSADSKNPIFNFCRILGPGQLRGPGVSPIKIWRGPSIERFGGGWGGLARRLCRSPPPQGLKAHPPLDCSVVSYRNHICSSHGWRRVALASFGVRLHPPSHPSQGSGATARTYFTYQRVGRMDSFVVGTCVDTFLVPQALGYKHGLFGLEFATTTQLAQTYTVVYEGRALSIHDCGAGMHWP